MAFVITGAFYFWIIGIGAEPRRFAWNSGLDQYYGLPGPTVAKGSAVNGYYDLLARAFANGKLYLPVEPQPELLALPNPWDIDANAPYRLLDAVLYNRHYYLYHGVMPALLLFTPWYLLTGHDLPENFAVFLLALGGYFFLSLLCLQILAFVSGRISLVLLMPCLLALGIGQMVPYLLHRAKVYEVAIAGGFFCLSAGFYFLFRWLVTSHRLALWAALSGLSFGLAIGCRPHVALGAACGFALLVFLPRPGTSFLERKDLLAFVLPLIVCGLGLGAHNYARFGNPIEFGTTYQVEVTALHPSVKNIVPGLYYLLLCPPDLVPEFPFVRLTLRPLFDSSVYALPAGYFLEPTNGLLTLSPVALIAVLTPLCWKLFGGSRRIFAFVSIILAFAIGCTLLVAVTGFSCQRFEVDFAPFLIFVACVVACELIGPLRGTPRTWATAALTLLVVYTIGANAAFAVQGPYDQFVQADPHTYVTLARWFSPFERFRLIENPTLRVQASFEFPESCNPEWAPLISTGEFGSRYLLSEACDGAGRLKLTSETSVQSPEGQTIEVPYSPGLNLVGLRYTPEDQTMTVSWNGSVILRQRLRFLITAPSQVHFGWDPTWGSKTTFPRRIVVYQQNVNSR